MVRRAALQFEPALWRFIRLATCIEWVHGGWEKPGNPGWRAVPVGQAVGGFVTGAIPKSTAGRYPEVPRWFHSRASDVFLPNAEALAHLTWLAALLVAEVAATLAVVRAAREPRTQASGGARA